MNHQFHKLLEHVGHKIECVTYGNQDEVSLECVECFEVLVTEPAEEEEEIDG